MTSRSLLTSLLTALLSTAGLLVASPAAACSCAQADTATSWTDADVVFTGTVVSRHVVHPDWPVMSSGDPALYVFAVDEVFKGEAHEQQGVLSAAESASCGLSLPGDGPFVVFASHAPDLPGGQYRAGLCGGTTPVDAGVTVELEELAATPAPRSPLGGAAGIVSSGGHPLGGYLWLGAGVLVLLGVGRRLRRGFRRPAP